MPNSNTNSNFEGQPALTTGRVHTVQVDLAILANRTAPLDVRGVDACSCQLVLTAGTIAGGMTITMKCSNDGSNWVTLPAGSVTLLAEGITAPFSLVGIAFLCAEITTINSSAARADLHICSSNLPVPLITVSGGAGRLLARTVLTAASGTHTTNAAAAKILVQVLAGGGGGGGSSSSIGAGSCGGGGASGGYAEKLFTVTPSTGYAYTCGALGAGGTAGATDGTAGTDSTFVVGATTVTAKGGPGGKGATATAGASVFLGGAAPAISTNGDLNGSGAPGGPGVAMSATVMVSGNGGASIWGGAAVGRKTQGTGGAAVNYGSGGAGGCCISAGGAVAGGDGSAGAIVVWEFSS